jgi:transcriptional regulator with XRE-family HTH domain
MQSNEDRRVMRQFREHFGLSLAEVAEKARLSEATLSYWEAGKRDLSQDSMQNLRKAIVKAAEEKIKRLGDTGKMPKAAQEMIATSSILVNLTVGEQKQELQKAKA